MECRSVREPARELPPALKRTEEFSLSFGTFLLFFGNNTARKLRLLAAGERSGQARAGRVAGFVFYL
jgi:hypothetical protein